MTHVSLWQRPASLRGALLLKVIVPLMAIMFGFSSVVLWTVERNSERRLQAEVELVARAVRLPLSASLEKNHERTLQQVLESVLGVGRVYGAYVYDRDGKLAAYAGAVEPDQDASAIQQLTEGGELTDRNNSAAISINGVRDRLRVLLVSGEPHTGERVWRNLLKSDANIDLIHFTILRPPDKFDGVPVDELSLIAFPTRELFVEKINDFDLIIFDRDRVRGILTPQYYDNIRRYVEEGGAILVSAGPEMSSVESLNLSPMGAIIPGRPTGRVYDQPFLPQLTDEGRRHPVTAGLTGAPALPAGVTAEVVSQDATKVVLKATAAADAPAAAGDVAPAATTACATASTSVIPRSWRLPRTVSSRCPSAWSAAARWAQASPLPH